MCPLPQQAEGPHIIRLMVVPRLLILRIMTIIIYIRILSIISIISLIVLTTSLTMVVIYLLIILMVRNRSIAIHTVILHSTILVVIIL